MSMETLLFEKKERYFPAKKTLQPIFCHFIEYKKPQVTNYEGPKGIVRVIVHVIRPFPEELKGCWKQKFLKKAIVPVTKTFWPCFSRIIEHQKSKTTKCRGSQGIFVFIV